MQIIYLYKFQSFKAFRWIDSYITFILHFRESYFIILIFFCFFLHITQECSGLWYFLWSSSHGLERAVWELWTCSCTNWICQLAIATQLQLCSTGMYEKSIYQKPSAPFWTRLVHSWNDECCRSINNRKIHWQIICITCHDKEKMTNIINH